MKHIDKDLNKPVLLKVPAISDVRGHLLPFSDFIDPNLINRVCAVGNFGKGVIRGIHYHKKEWKIYSVITGAAKFLSVDIPEELVDKGSEFEIKNYLEENPENIKSYVLSERSPGVLVIPSWYANGWISLADNTNVIFMSNLSFEDAKDDDYRFNPFVVSPDRWSVN